MLQIRLSKPVNDVGGSAKPGPVETVTVACPDHLILADLPVAKSLGTPIASAVAKTIGRRSRRQLGERVHFCVRCDFPIAIYGRLIPCEHAFCLDCARSDPVCDLCEERIQKIQTIKMMEGIFICAAPRCLKSFLKKSDFEFHINESHADILHPHKEREVHESEAMSARKLSTSDSTVQGPVRSFFSPSSNSRILDREDKTQCFQVRDQPSPGPGLQPRPMPSFSGQLPSHPYEQHPDINQVPERAAFMNFVHQQSFVPNSALQPDLVDPNSVQAPPQFGEAHYASDGTHQYQYFGGTPYELARPDSVRETGPGQGSLFQPGPSGPSMNYAQHYPQPWNMGQASGALEPPLISQGNSGGFLNADPQGRGLFHTDYAQNMGNVPSNVSPHATNRPMDPRQGGRDGKGMLAQQTMAHPPPLAPHPHLAQLQPGRFSNDGNHDAPPGFGWQNERHDCFAGAQE